MLMAVGEVARELQVSPRQIWKLVASGRLPKPVRLGRSVRWRRDDLVAWIGAGCPAIDQWEAARREGER